MLQKPELPRRLAAIGLPLTAALLAVFTAAPAAISTVPAPARSAATPRPAPRLASLETSSVYRFIEARAGARAARRYTRLIQAKAGARGISPLLVAKVINRESSFRPHVSHMGCHGLMQVAGFHFKRGQNPHDPATNIEAGCRMLANLHRRFGNWPQALTAYNMGPYAVASRGIGTSRYARQVMAGR